jgi:hypothetical protein
VSIQARWDVLGAELGDVLELPRVREEARKSRGEEMSYRGRTLYVLHDQVLVADTDGTQLGVFASMSSARAYVRSLHRGMAALARYREDEPE